jgi:cob(I)alamin adenosyltransferase
MKKGLNIINTGNGKGKTTASLGLALRTVGNGKHVCIIQFIKNSSLNCGEHKALAKLGVEIIPCGVGFTNESRKEENLQCLQNALEISREKIMSDQYEMIILDEIIYAVNIKQFDVSSVITNDIIIDMLREKPERLHIVLTGRGADQSLIDYCDMVTEMHEIKHHYNSGIEAQECIEF